MIMVYTSIFTYKSVRAILICYIVGIIRCYLCHPLHKLSAPSLCLNDRYAVMIDSNPNPHYPY